MLTIEQLSHFRAQLEQQRAALQAQAADVERQVAEPNTVDDAVSDLGDEGNLLFAHEQGLDEIAQLQQTLAQVENALQRIEAGTYGLSEVSGQPIPVERLEALPYATTLVGEQTPE